MYTVLSVLFLLLVYRELDKGPEPFDASKQAEPRKEAA
jgi:hypothetical protein